MQKTVQQWLNLVCQMLPGVNRAIVVGTGMDTLGGDSTRVKQGCENLLARFPEQAFDCSDLLSAAALAAERRVATMSADPLANPSNSQPGNTNPRNNPNDLLVAFPLDVAALGGAVVSVQLNAGVEHHTVVNQILAWSQSWLRLLLEPVPETSATGNVGLVPGATMPEAMASVINLDLFDEAFASGDSKTAAAAAASVLKERFACQRVSIGLGDASAIEIAAVSDIQQFDGRVNELRDIEKLMRDACAKPVGEPSADIGDCKQEDKLDNKVVSLTGGDVATPTDSNNFHAMPLIAQQQSLGAVVLQRNRPFECAELAHIDALAKVLAAQFALQQYRQRVSIASVKARWRDYFQQLFGPGFFKTKLISGALGFALLFLLVIPGDYRVAAQASLEGKIQRAVVAPFEG